MDLNLIFAVILVVFALVYLRIEHHARKVKIIVLIVVGLLLYLSVVSVFGSKKFDLSSPEGILKAGYSYVGWIGHSVLQIWDIGKDSVKAVGNVIKNESRSDR